MPDPKIHTKAATEALIALAIAGVQQQVRERCARIADEHDADEEYERGCWCGHSHDEHDHGFEDASPCEHCDGCVEFRPLTIGDKIRGVKREMG